MFELLWLNLASVCDRNKFTGNFHFKGHFSLSLIQILCPVFYSRNIVINGNLLFEKNLDVSGRDGVSVVSKISYVRLSNILLLKCSIFTLNAL